MTTRPLAYLLIVLCGCSRPTETEDADDQAAAKPGQILSLLHGLPAEKESGPQFLERTAWEKGWGAMSRVWVEDRSLVLTCEDDRVIVGYKAEPFPFDVATRPFLHFSLRVDALPLNADLSRKRTDDACFRLFLVFGEQSWFSTPPMLGYTWAAREEPGSILTSPHYDQIKYVVIGKGKPTEGAFLRFVRDVAADYRAAFAGAKPPRLHGVLLKLDTNQLGGRGASRLNYLALAPTDQWHGPRDPEVRSTADPGA
jgi:hypothetical protein